MSLRRRSALAVVLAVTGHQLALAAGRVASHDGGLEAAVHGAAWGTAVGLVLAGFLTATLVIAWRVLALRLSLRMTPTINLPTGGALLRAWGSVTMLALVGFLAQENVEHLTQHGHLPLLEPLFSGQYASVLPIFAGLGLLLAAAGLTIGTALQRLEQAARVSTAHRRPPPRRLGSRRERLHDRRRRARMVTAFNPWRGPPNAVVA
jgi:hypothetical protein